MDDFMSAEDSEQYSVDFGSSNTIEAGNNLDRQI